MGNGQVVEVPPSLIKRQKQHFTSLEGTGRTHLPPILPCQHGSAHHLLPLCPACCHSALPVAILPCLSMATFLPPKVPSSGYLFQGAQGRVPNLGPLTQGPSMLKPNKRNLTECCIQFCNSAEAGQSGVLLMCRVVSDCGHRRCHVRISPTSTRP